MQTSKPSIEALTGLRFIAALTVFIHHLGGKFGLELNPYSIGSAAVTFFFVLSGFILVYVYHDRLDNWSQVKRFLFNRFARIWPLHVACLIIAVATLQSTKRLENAEDWWQLATSVLLLQSWTTNSDWLLSFNGVSWSISTEAFFYLVFPLLAFAAGKRFRISLSLTLVIIGTAIVGLNIGSQQGINPEWEYFRIGQFNPLIRLPDFLIGVIGGYVFLQRQTGEMRPYQIWVDTAQEVVLVALIVTTCIWVSNERLPQQISQARWGSEFLGSWFRVEYPVVLFGLTVYVFAKSRGLFAKLAANRVLVYLGNVSYAFYLVHFLVIRNIFLAHDSYGVLSPWWIGGMAFLIALGAAILLYELVEMPTKTLLHAWYDRSRTEQRQFFSTGYLLSKSTLASLLVVVPFWFLSTKITEYERTEAVQAIISKSDREFTNINFGSQVRLLGVETITKPKKLEIRFAWLKRVEFAHRRLVQVFDKNENLIARGQHNQEVFLESLPGQSFTDVAYVPLDALQPGNEIVVMFRSKEFGVLTVAKGRRRLRNKALVISHEIINAKETGRKKNAKRPD